MQHNGNYGACSPSLCTERPIYSRNTHSFHLTPKHCPEKPELIFPIRLEKVFGSVRTLRPQCPLPFLLIERTARDREAPLALVEQEWQWQYLNVSVEVSPEMQRFTAWPKAHPSPKPVYTLPLLGRHQVVNAVTALATVDRLRDIPPRAVHAGLQSTRWPGRLQVLGRRPWVIVDGAHNGDSMRKLCATITELFPYRELILVFGVSAGHDPDPMLDALLPYADQVLVTQARHPRAEQPQALAERFAARGKQAKAIPIDRALGEALVLAGEEDLICATGSLFLVADFSRAWFKHRLEPMPPSD